MQNLKKLWGLGIAVFLITLGLTGCFSNESEQVAIKAAKIESDDECHLCGMIISRFPGPKGEAVADGAQSVHKFCSTADLLVWAFDPENKASIKQMFVHDMAETPWGKPNDEHFIDAESAFYVAGSSLKGAMGATFASFSTQDHAKAFAHQFGGKVLRFEELNLDLIVASTHSSMMAH